jgi:hypothetical protein
MLQQYFDTLNDHGIPDIEWEAALHGWCVIREFPEVREHLQFGARILFHIPLPDIFPHRLAVPGT